MAETLEPGLVIGRDMVRDGAFTPLIRSGTCLTPEIIDRVRKLGLERQVLRCVDWRLRRSGGILEDDLIEDNVMVLGIAMGRAAGYDDKHLCAIGAAALVHDVGEDELALNDGLRRFSAMPLVRDTLLLFREWQAGTGVLRQGDDDSSPHPAEILAVADLYDTTLADKPASTRMPPGVAFETIRQMAGRRLDSRAVRMFCKSVRPYPAGTTVLLTDRRKALVLRSSAENPLRPVVAVGTEQIDLSETRSLQIADAFVVRREQRVEMGVPVRLHIDDRDVVWGMLVDVSDHGACLEVDGTVASAFRVEIELGVNGSATLRSRGVVCRTRPTGERTTRIGLFAPAGGLRKAVLTHVNCAS